MLSRQQSGAGEKAIVIHFSTLSAKVAVYSQCRTGFRRETMASADETAEHRVNEATTGCTSMSSLADHEPTVIDQDEAATPPPKPNMDVPISNDDHSMLMWPPVPFGGGQSAPGTQHCRMRLAETASEDLACRARRASSSSSDTATVSSSTRKRPRRNRSKKSKTDKVSCALDKGTIAAEKLNIAADSVNIAAEVNTADAAPCKPVLAAEPSVDSSSSQGSCAECQTDLTDTDVEMCQTCFGLKKARKMEELYCPYPFHFIPKKYIPLWLHEPEYMIWHPPKPKTVSPDSEQQQKKASIADLIHRNTDSLFSTSSNFNNYRGLLNLALILLVLSNARLCIENLIKYGVLIEPLETVKSCFRNLDNWPNVQILMYQVLHPTVAFVVEYFLLSKGRIPDWLGAVIHVINGLVQLTYPAYIVLQEHPNPVFSAFTLALVTVWFLKLISYAHVNYWCRTQKVDLRRRRQSSSGDHSELDGTPTNNIAPPPTPIVTYPNNLTVKDLAYFLVAPTLCYELNFPRSARIRKRFLIKRMVEMVFLLTVIIGLVQQWIVPTINNSIKPLSQLEFFKCVERLLKLSVPNHFIWLMFFYAFFHSALNVLAELLMFGDRDFYQDWWNADNIERFWSTWNIPVHRWASRHIYKPLRKRGYGKMTGSVIVFIVSAFFHEYLVSIPLRMFKYWAFMGMVMQVPLAYMTSRFLEGKWGNIVVWLSLILGQPIAILAYVHDYYIFNIVSQTVNVTDTVGTATLHTEL